MTEKPKIAVAMSGGVDSSVSAALLIEQGYQVIGLTLRLWGDTGKGGAESAQRVASLLDIPFHLVDARDPFRRDVVEPMISSYASGRTPNPCMLCNRAIKWKFLLDQALSLDANFLATGHYARVRREKTGYVLLRGLDPQKDQSYVLSVLGQKELARAVFPLGERTKPEVRRLARQMNLPVTDRPESQDLCFLAGTDYRSFLGQYAPQVFRPGPILSRSGEVLGQHNGLVGYTIGQRKGIRLASPRALFVLSLDAERNALIVGTADELGKRGLIAEEAHWVGGEAPDSPFRAGVKIRYKAEEQQAEVITEEGGLLRVRFDRPLRDITPGQAAVLYQGERCLGMAFIREATA